MIHVQTLFLVRKMLLTRKSTSGLRCSSFPWGLLPWALCCMGLALTVMLSVTILQYATSHNLAPQPYISPLVCHGVHKTTNFQFTCFSPQKIEGMLHHEALAMPGSVLNRPPSEGIMDTHTSTSSPSYEVHGDGGTSISFPQVCLLLISLCHMIVQDSAPNKVWWLA